MPDKHERQERASLRSLAGRTIKRARRNKHDELQIDFADGCTLTVRVTVCEDWSLTLEEKGGTEPAI